MAMAYKRAKSFPVEYAGPFTALSIRGRNFAWLFDADREITPDDALDDLHVFNWWAERLNAACDAGLLRDNLDLQYELASFKSRIWVDPTKLL